MEWNSKSLRRVMLLIAFAVLLFLGLQNLSLVTAFLGTILRIFAPFLVGLCIAFVLNVPMRFIETKIFREKKPPGKIWRKLRRPTSLVLTLLFVAAIVFVVLFLIIPEISKTVHSMAENIPPFMNHVQNWVENNLGQSSTFGTWVARFEVDWQKLGEQLMTALQSGAGGLLNMTVNVVTSVIGAMVTFVLGFIFALYVLLQKEKLANQIQRLMAAYLSERWQKRILSVSALSDETFSGFLSGQCLESVILGGLFFTGMSIFRFPYALMISVLIGFTSLIPLFGAVIGCVVGALFILMVDPMKAFWFLLLFLVIQQIEGNLIYPYVVGNSVGLPSLWVLVAVTIGGSTMGIFGMILFIPLCSVVYSLLREAVKKRLVRKKAQQEELDKTG